jgi:hypothetical protein
MVVKALCCLLVVGAIVAVLASRLRTPTARREGRRPPQPPK